MASRATQVRQVWICFDLKKEATLLVFHKRFEVHFSKEKKVSVLPRNMPQMQWMGAHIGDLYHKAFGILSGFSACYQFTAVSAILCTDTLRVRERVNSIRIAERVTRIFQPLKTYGFSYSGETVGADTVTNSETFEILRKEQVLLGQGILLSIGEKQKDDTCISEQ